MKWYSTFGALASIILLAGCTQPATEELPTPTQTPQQDTVAPTATTEVDTFQETQTGEYTIEMSNFAYSVEQMEAKPGETISVTLVNIEGNHDLIIDELDFHSPHLEEVGETATFEITIPEDAEAGTTYEYYCSVGSHREMGMVGTLKVI